MFEAIQLGPFIFWTHLAFFIVGVWLSSEFFFRLAHGAHLSLQHFKEYALWYACAFALGGRIIAIVSEYRVYLKDPLRMMIFWDGNFSFLGGAIGIACVLYVITHAHRSTFLQWLDVLLPATTFGMAFDWLGKFTAGQAYGSPTDVLWAVTYDAIHVRYTVPIHPVQLYYAFFFFALTLILLIVRKQMRRAGAETLIGIVLGTLATVFFEIFRGDFGVLVLATPVDFAVLLALFGILGIFTILEITFTRKSLFIYGSGLTVGIVVYLFMRQGIPVEPFELRFSQFLAILSLLATVVYVVVHRKKYPHL
jgi:phosphatidylglycerol---prolipoprotein diacylglyceryl transferase